MNEFVSLRDDSHFLVCKVLLGKLSQRSSIVTTNKDNIEVSYGIADLWLLFTTTSISSGGLNETLLFEYSV